MTIIIGVPAEEGVVLAADCLIGHSDEEKSLGRKIIYGTRRFGKSRSTRPVAYWAQAGLMFEGVHGAAGDALFKGAISRFPNVVDQLTHQLTIERNLDELYAMKDGLDEQLRVEQDEEAFDRAIDELGYVESVIEARIFINQRGLNRLQQVVLRPYTKTGPDLVHVGDGRANPIRKPVAYGIGAKIVKEQLKKVGVLSTDDAVAFSISMMNTVLEEDDFQGYSFVIAHKGPNGVTIHTAEDMSATHIDNLECGDAKFRAIS